MDSKHMKPNIHHSNIDREILSQGQTALPTSFPVKATSLYNTTPEIGVFIVEAAPDDVAPQPNVCVQRDLSQAAKIIALGAFRAMKAASNALMASSLQDG